MSAPYQAIENMAASIGRQRPASYQRRQQITVPYQEIENPLKIRANSGKISCLILYKIYLFFPAFFHNLKKSCFSSYTKQYFETLIG